MRLGQLARKVALPPSEITAYLASQQISIVDSANTRLDDTQVTLVLQRFAPELLDAGIQTEPDEPEVSETPVISEAPVEEPAEAELPSAEENQSVNTETEKPEEIEVIKAPKVTLSGLKVLGKIELPEKKKKPEPEALNSEVPANTTSPESAAASTQTPRERRRPDHKKREHRDQRPKKNPVALAREREERAAEEKRKEELRRKKERQTENYLRRVQAKAPTKAARIIKEEVIDMSSVDLRPAPKTWLGKFWRWFRS